MKPELSTARTVTDPVCGMAVDPRMSDLAATIGGKTYYFCAEGCRQSFEAAPQKYLDGGTKKKKGWWGRYLDRLEKATGGKSMSCH
jgi:YHS domain-containing protein